MNIGIPLETHSNEPRVAATPDSVRRLTALGVECHVESGAGNSASYLDEEYKDAGATITDRSSAFGCEVVFKVRGPDADEIKLMNQGSLLVSHIDLHDGGTALDALAAAGIDAIAMEKIPRISRAQSMDALSSQANIAGYRAVITAVNLYGRFFPLMMTAAGSAKPAKVYVIGAGVAGLQAIATAKRLGAQVFGYDIRPEVSEQIESLGAKFVTLDIGESGAGEGGYAKELSEEGKEKQMQLLTEELKKADIIITTAQIPGRPAPVLVTEDAVKGMREGSIIVDLAAGSGGNCPLSEADQTVTKHGVTLVGETNLPGAMPADASSFYARNLVNLSAILFVKDEESGATSLAPLLEDEITDGALVTHDGKVRQPGS
jgi:NAD(P) transhydrogenase subunit alpha